MTPAKLERPARPAPEVPASREFAMPAARTSAIAPIAEGKPDVAYDGAFVGASGKAYPPGTPLASVPPILPADGRKPTETIIYVNGIHTDKAKQFGQLQELANGAGAAVIGIHNATEGYVGDAAQTFGDKLNVSKNPATDTLAATLLDKLKKGESVQILGHSQGGVVVSNALRQVRADLIKGGMSEKQATDTLGKVKVETFAAAAYRYPDGPKYVHYVNRLDPVPLALGQLSLGISDHFHGGAGAVIHRFTDAGSGKPHNFGLYVDHRKPFDVALKTPPQRNAFEKVADVVNKTIDADGNRKLDLNDAKALAAALGVKIQSGAQQAAKTVQSAAQQAAKTVKSGVSKAATTVTNFVKNLKFF